MRALSKFSALSVFSVTFSDSSASTVAGRVLYDAFGGVLTRSVPISNGSPLTGTLPPGMIDLLAGQASIDPDAGLVYLGNGRYFDPVLGLPLQPNPLGGVPTVPQSLNRYAAGSLGQPGVAEGVMNGGGGVASLLEYGVGVGNTWAFEVHGIGLAQAIAPRQSVHTGVYGDARIDLYTLNDISNNAEAMSIIDSLHGRVNGIYTVIRFGRDVQKNIIKIPVRGSDLDAEAEVLARRFVAFGELGYVDGIPKRDLFVKRAIGLESAAKLKTVLGFGADVAIGAGFQLYEDWGNPYLTGGQKVSRAVISGGFGALFGTVATATFCGASGGLACIVIAGVGGGIVWAIGFQPLVFQLSPLRPVDRNLKPFDTP